MKILTLIIAFLVHTCINAQNPTRPKQADTKQLERATKKIADSLTVVFSNQYKGYERKMDSSATALYQKQLERGITIESGKDTYYGTIFSGIGVAVAILTILYGLNIFTSRKETKKLLKELSDEAKKALENERQSFIERIKTIENQSKQFQETNQKIINDDLALLREKLKNAGDKTTDKTKLEEIEKELERYKGYNITSIKKGEVQSVSVDMLGRPFQLQCANKNCGKILLYDPPLRLKSYALASEIQNSLLFGSQHRKKDIVVCPYCGYTNELPPQV